MTAKQTAQPGSKFPAWSAMGAAVFGTLIGGAAVFAGLRGQPLPEDPAGPGTETPLTSGPVDNGVDPHNLHPQGQHPGARRSPLVTAIAKTAGSVVCLKADERIQGAGVIYEGEGLVFTNYHVVEPVLSKTGMKIRGGERSGGRLTVQFENGRELPATIVLTSQAEDIALLRLEPADTAERFTASTIGHSADLAVGEQVFAVGCPVGLGQTVSTGIVSAIGRTDILPNRQLPVVQLDASINLGDSGGPLFNGSGELVGITTARSKYGEGIGFAIPIDRVMALLRAFQRGESSRASQISVWLDPIPEVLPVIHSLGYSTGFTVKRVMDGPAKKAGLQQGDIVVEVRGRRYDELGGDENGRRDFVARFVEVVRSLIPGEILELAVVREGGELQKIAIVVEAASDPRQARIDIEAILGVRLAHNSEVPKIVEILESSRIGKFPGAKRLVHAQITHILGKPVGSIEELGAIIGEIELRSRGRRRSLTVSMSFVDPADTHFRVQAFPLTVRE